MRIGVDTLAITSPYSRGRGIGRYSGHLLEALLDAGRAHEFVLYAHDDLPAARLPRRPNARLARLRVEDERGERSLRAAMERLVAANPDRVDAMLILSPFELYGGFGPPSVPIGGPRMVAVLYDLIPFLFQERYLTDPWAARWFYGHAERLKKYDRLLAISEATRADALRLFGLPGDRVVAIGGASDGRFFTPAEPGPPAAEERAILERLGLDRPFIYCLASSDDRKNVRGLIDGFALLPGAMRAGHRVVVGCALTGDEADKVRRMASEAGVADALVLTGELDDLGIRLLYRRCAAFAFPSLYEGLGLPILEAMHCGAPVLAGANSSQPEVVGDAGLLVNAHDAAEIARGLRSLLEDRALAADLGRRGRLRAAEFRWGDVAARALEALETPPASRGRRRARPALAIATPLPPAASGVADYVARLVGPLGREFRIDLFHDSGAAPDLGSASAEVGCFDLRLLDRMAGAKGYAAILYQMGNSSFHGSIYRALLRRPGLVDLHDFNLAGFHYWHGHEGRGDRACLMREVSYDYPGLAPEIARRLDDWSAEPGGVDDAFARRGLWLNRRIFERSAGAIVHSRWCRDQLEGHAPWLADRVAVVPLGADLPAVATPERRAATRRRFGLAPDALVIGSFGILHPTKLNRQALVAFRAVADDLPRAHMLFVGEDLGNGEAAAAALGLAGRVTFAGRRSPGEYADLIAATDLGLALRRPPTNGESSASLLELLGHGVATIVVDAASFGELPDAAVRKVRWSSEAEGVAGLAEALLDLGRDPAARSRIGAAARELVATRHDWGRVVGGYVDAIGACGRRRRPAADPGWAAVATRPSASIAVAEA